MDDQRTDRESGGGLGRDAEERKVRTIGAAILAIFFIVSGSWSLYRGPQSPYMLGFGLFCLVYAVRNYQGKTRSIASWEGPVGGLLGGLLVGVATGNWSFLVIIAI